MRKHSHENRKGDTSRTSSQGRKRASGGTTTKRKGNPDINENTRNELKDVKTRKLRIPAKAIIR
jgi:hypothetical protein